MAHLLRDALRGFAENLDEAVRTCVHAGWRYSLMYVAADGIADIFAVNFWVLLIAGTLVESWVRGIGFRMLRTDKAASAPALPQRVRLVLLYAFPALFDLPVGLLVSATAVALASGAAQALHFFQIGIWQATILMGIVTVVAVALLAAAACAACMVSFSALVAYCSTVAHPGRRRFSAALRAVFARPRFVENLIGAVFVIALFELTPQLLSNVQGRLWHALTGIPEGLADGLAVAFASVWTAREQRLRYGADLEAAIDGSVEALPA